MTLPLIPVITVFERSPDRGRGLALTCVFAGRLKKWANLTRFVLFRSGQ